ncbi:hypothetical protein ACE4ZB_013840 [Enterococcus faecalis]|uniref:hypothetical protein n=1 Tax=Enterococcus faecalis TaxID=1351 RepID=UPI0035E6CA37
MKNSTIVFLLLICVFFISGCSVSTEKNTEPAKQVFSRVEPVELASIDVSLATDGYSQTVLSNVNEGLYRAGKDEKLDVEDSIIFYDKKWMEEYIKEKKILNYILTEEL